MGTVSKDPVPPPTPEELLEEEAQRKAQFFCFDVLSGEVSVDPHVWAYCLEFEPHYEDVLLFQENCSVLLGGGK